MKKYLLLIALAFIIGLSLSSVQAISPFTAIGNLEMEVLDTINDIIIELTAQTERIDLLNATEISEQVEQDGIQIDISNLQGNQTETLVTLAIYETDIGTLQEQTKSLESGKFTIPGRAINPTEERLVNGTIIPTFIPSIFDFEFSSFQNHIVFTNRTIVDISGPHLLPSFVNSLDMFFKERLADGTIVNHPLCSITAGDSISECNLIGWNSTVVPQSPSVRYFVDSNADTNIYDIFDIESIFSITITHP